MYRLITVFIAAFCFYVKGYAAETITNYNPIKGWYWYQNPSKKTKNKKKKTVKNNSVHYQTYTYKQLYNMYPDEFQAVLKRALKQAVQNPTVDNVKQYLLLQDIARRKSAEFTNVVTYVTQRTPSLSLTKDYPNATPGINTRRGQMYAENRKVLSDAAGKYGLLFFVKDKCPYCNREAAIVEYLESKYNWDVVTVNVDKKPDVASVFKVKYTPELVLVDRKSGKWINAGNGVLAENQLENRLYRGVRYFQGKIDPRNWNIYDFQKGGGFDMSVKPVNENTVFKIEDVGKSK